MPSIDHPFRCGMLSTSVLSSSSQAIQTVSLVCSLMTKNCKLYRITLVTNCLYHHLFNSWMHFYICESHMTSCHTPLVNCTPSLSPPRVTGSYDKSVRVWSTSSWEWIVVIGSAHKGSGTTNVWVSVRGCHLLLITARTISVWVCNDAW